MDELRRQNKKIGFVPTMGALHQGHLSLIGIARDQCEQVVASIFVNPTQFNDPADLDKYPRPIEEDIKKLESARCDILFLPEVDEMYRAGERWHLELGELECILEGASRPGHYQGVTQIVSKLFDLVKPDLAFFGQKDFQQVMVLRKMIAMLDYKIELNMCPIVREADGLALSSRNIHLSGVERKQALALFNSLKLVKDQFQTRDLPALKELGLSSLRAADGISVDYFEILRQEDLAEACDKSQPLIALVAAQVGATRLIDNMILN